MVQLILVRPGCTDFDLQARIQGTLDIPLNDEGRKQSAEIAEKLKPYLPTAVYYCPVSSAEETATIIADALDLKAKGLDKLQNVNLGLWQGMLVDEVRHKQPKVYKQWQEHPEMVHPPEGEGISEVHERAEDCLEKLARKHKTGTIVLVAAEPLASIVRRRLEGGTLGDLWRATNGCSKMNVLHLDAVLEPAPAAKENGKHTPPGTFVYRGVTINGK
jgi:phosphoserine phosphatase